MQENTYGEMQKIIADLENTNQLLSKENLSLKMKVQTLEAFLQPYGAPVQPLEKNCGSNCVCNQNDSNNL